MVDGQKRCAVCGRVFDLAAFRALPLIGVTTYDGDPFRLEFRDCHCGNTLTIEIDWNGTPIAA